MKNLCRCRTVLLISVKPNKDQIYWQVFAHFCSFCKGTNHDHGNWSRSGLVVIMWQCYRWYWWTSMEAFNNSVLTIDYSLSTTVWVLTFKTSRGHWGFKNCCKEWHVKITLIALQWQFVKSHHVNIYVKTAWTCIASVKIQNSFACTSVRCDIEVDKYTFHEIWLTTTLGDKCCCQVLRN